MPTVSRTVAKSVLTLAALAAITGAMIFQTVSAREAEGAGVQPVANVIVPRIGVPLPSIAREFIGDDIGPGIAEPLLVGTLNSPEPARRQGARR